MITRPIDAGADMVRALIAGLKTQTRVVVKLNVAGRVQKGRRSWHPDDPDAVLACPFGQPGTLLWVRETFWQARRYPETMPSGEPERHAWTRGRLVHYAADGDPANTPNRHYPKGLGKGRIAAPDPYASWERRPSVHMPRWASRVTLEIVGVRLERLQDIGEDDALADGGWRYATCPLHKAPIASFREFWDRTYAGAGCGWDTNPLVWALSFSVISKNVDELLKEAA